MDKNKFEYKSLVLITFVGFFKKADNPRVKKYPVVLRVLIFLCSFLFFSSHSKAQQDTLLHWHLELHAGVQGSFGPSETQAELVGGTDTISYDHQQHISPGFRSCTLFELTAGYQKKWLQLQGTFTYFRQDIGLVYTLSKNEYPFLLADMLTIKVTAMAQLSNPERQGAYGFKSGLFISTTLPLSWEIYEETQTAYSISAFEGAMQFNWGLDYTYSMPLGKKGFYAIGGMSITMPGYVNSIGKIELQPVSSYSLTRDEIIMYSVKGFAGAGIRF